MRHKAVDSIKWKHDLVSLIVNGLIDDVLPILSDERRKEVQEYQSKLNAGIFETIRDIKDRYSIVCNIVSQKAFAETIKDDKYKAFLFALRNKKVSAESIVMSYVKKQCYNQASVKELELFLGVYCE